MRSFKRFFSLKDGLLFLLAGAAILYLFSERDVISSKISASSVHPMHESSATTHRSMNLRSNPSVPSDSDRTIFDFTVKDIEGNVVSFSEMYKNDLMKAMLIVNVASN